MALCGLWPWGGIWASREVCRKQGCTGTRPEWLGGKPSGTKAERVAKELQQTIDDLRRQLSEKGSSSGGSNTGSEKGDEAAAKDIKGDYSKDLECARSMVSTLKKFPGVEVGALAYWQGRLDDLAKKQRETKPTSIQIRNLAASMARTKKQAEKLEQETIPKARQELEKAEAELAEKNKALEAMALQHQTLLRSQAPGFEDGAKGAEHVAEAFVQLAPEGPAGDVFRRLGQQAVEELARARKVQAEAAAAAEAEAAAKVVAAEQQKKEGGEAATTDMDEDVEDGPGLAEDPHLAEGMAIAMELAASHGDEQQRKRMADMQEALVRKKVRGSRG